MRWVAEEPPEQDGWVTVDVPQNSSVVPPVVSLSVWTDSLITAENLQNPNLLQQTLSGQSEVLA